MPTSAASAEGRKRILVMRYRFIGDTLLMVPFLRNLRAAYPDAKVDVLVAPNSGELLRDCPYVDELIVFDTSRKHRYENPAENSNEAGQARSFWSYVKLLRARKYDTAFVLKRSFSSAALAFLAGIPERIGFDTEARGFLLTHRVPYRKDAHEVDCFLEVLKAADIPVMDRHLECWWQVGDAEKASALADDQAYNVVLHLSSSNAAKQWPLRHATTLAEKLLVRSDCQIHCLGAPSDAHLYEALQKMLSPDQRQRVHIHCGQLDLLESLAFLKCMHLVVGVDSGTLHMASAVGVPVIALFGPMNETKWGPLNARIVTQPVACRPCNLEHPCRYDFQCMTTLSPETVMAEIEAYAGFA